MIIIALVLTNALASMKLPVARPQFVHVLGVLIRHCIHSKPLLIFNKNPYRRLQRVIEDLLEIKISSVRRINIISLQKYFLCSLQMAT